MLFTLYCCDHWAELKPVQKIELDVKRAFQEVELQTQEIKYRIGNIAEPIMDTAQETLEDIGCYNYIKKIKRLVRRTKNKLTNFFH